ncbi:MAG: alpha/beta hydrolase [Burkholderiales bacterium]|nr:alpha/beta hydrolase [Burkholderiales bacterium]
MKPRHDTVWLESQYDNRARVPGHAVTFERWRRASAWAREHSLSHLDLRYADDPGATLDLFTTTTPKAPVLIAIHGGYWRSLDKSDFSFLAPSFTAAGALVVVPNYALCPAVTIEQITLQLAAAVAWVWRHAERYGGDPARIAVVGHSAGAHLAAMLLSCRWRQFDEALPAQPLAGALAISGLYDLEPLRHAPFIQGDLRLTPAAVARLSPAFFPRPKAAKLYAVVGADESDEFVRQNRLIRDVWGPTAVPVCEELPGADHFSIVTDLADPDGRLHGLALKLLGL